MCEAQETLARKELLAFLGQLVSGVAHQIRNPLAAITNATYVLEHHLLPAQHPNVDEAIRIIHDEVRHANSIITGLLDFARVRTLDRHPTSIVKLLDRVLHTAGIPATITVARHIENIPLLDVDADQLHIVLFNVIRNASEAMTKGGELRIEMRKAYDSVLIAITDTGPGISPEVRAHLFEPLHSTKPMGIGLGLVTARAFIEAHGGHIVCVDVPKGARFEIQLPLRANHTGWCNGPRYRASAENRTMSTTSETIESRPERRDGGFLHRTICVGEISLHVVEARPKGDGSNADSNANHTTTSDVPLVVFLHGFPEYWRSWRHQLQAFAKAGFWAVAPDMRGYGGSDKPEGVAAYEVEHLAADIAGLIRALGRENAIVVGHDWGALVAWYVAQLYPERVKRLAILNVPHPAQMMKGLRTLRQLAKSWYMFFFQLPAVPERAVQVYNFAFLRKMFEVDGIGADDINHFISALRTPRALTSAMNYYRAAIRRAARGRLPPTRRIEAPVLVVWGDADRYLGKELATPPAEFVPNARVVHIPGASHWIQNVEHARVNELLLNFSREP